MGPLQPTVQVTPQTRHLARGQRGLKSRPGSTATRNVLAGDAGARKGLLVEFVPPEPGPFITTCPEGGFILIGKQEVQVGAGVLGT